MYEQLQGERNASTKHTYLLPTLATNTCYQHFATNTCYQNLLPTLATNICYQHLLPTLATNNTCYQQHLLPTTLATNTCYQHLLPTLATSTCYQQHLLPTLATNTCYQQHLLPTTLATNNTCYQHLLPILCQHLLPTLATNTCYHTLLPTLATNTCYQQHFATNTLPILAANTCYQQHLLPTLATNTCYQNLLPILCQHFLDGHQQINRVGHNHILNTYIQCIYGLFIREITIQTAIYGVYIRFWPTLQIKHASTPTQEWLDPSKQKQGDTKEGFYVGCDFTPDVPEISKPIHGRNQVCSDCGGVASNSKHGQNQASMQGLR